MKYEPIFNYKARVTIFDLEKPIYGSFYAIWDKWLTKTHNLGFKLVVNTSLGTSTFKNVDEYKEGAERLERFFKNPEVPMIFWGRHLKPDVDTRVKRKKAEKKDRLSPVYDISPTFSVLEEIKRRNPDLMKKLGRS